MKVLVIGATGLTGSLAVQRLLDRGDSVVALVRDPASYPVHHERVTAAKGDARDAASLEAAMRGCDAVFSSFGPRSMKKDDLQETFMKNLVAAMKATGVKRLSNLSAWGVGDSRPALNLVGKIFRALVLKNLFADKERGEAHLLASGLDWVSVRPSRLVNKKARGAVKASLDFHAVSQFPLMTRDDVAAFMIEQLTSDTWLRQSPLIGY